MEPNTTVSIPEGYDMNNGLPPQPPIPTFLPLPDDIFENLPPLLAAGCSKFTQQEEKELFLVGALGVLSGMLPQVEAVYDGRRVGANLFVFVMGNYGTGKGALLWARALGEAVETLREQKAEALAKEHHNQQMHYQRQVKLYDKGKLQEPPQPPALPPNLKLFIPANSSKSAIIQVMKENDGRGIIFETEADTLAGIFGQDFGDFSDVLRKAFHHEPVSISRKTNNEFVKIARPALSMVLSGTPDQLLNLINHIHNGLFSRFCFYVLQPRVYFRNPFDENKSDYEYYFNVLADRFAKLYQQLEAREAPLVFSLQPQQQQAFARVFEASKMDIYYNVSNELEGTVNRMGLICYRIAMILTTLRFGGVAHADDTISCSNIDFENAIHITRHLMAYSVHVYGQLTQFANAAAPMVYAVDKTREAMIKEACVCYNNGETSYRKVSVQVFGSIRHVSTVYGWIQDNCKKSA